MVEAHIFINNTDIGCLRCRNLGRKNKKGETLYEALYVHPLHVFKFRVTHKRESGAEALLGKAMTLLSHRKSRFFGFEGAKVNCEDNIKCIRTSDLPKRYREPFLTWMNGQTCISTKDGEMAVFLDDLDRWLQSQINGTTPVFD